MKRIGRGLCAICKKEEDLRHFVKCKPSHCKACENRKKSRSPYYKNYRKELHQKPEYREKYNAWRQKRNKIDLDTRLRNGLRSRFKEALQGNSKKGSAIQDLGCTVAQFRTYLESLFEPGMTWKNHTSDGWHIDHIIPLSAFDLSDPIQVRIACHYLNLRPLWAQHNVSKSNKIDPNQMDSKVKEIGISLGLIAENS